MASVDEDLDGLWAEIGGEFERREVRVFPAPLLRAPLEPGTWPPSRRLAEPQKRFPWPMSVPISAPLWTTWPTDAGIASFLDLAAELRVGLVYAYRWYLEPFAIDDLRAFLSSVGEPSAEASRLLDEAQEHLGATRLIQVAFSHDGIGHFWWFEASWYRTLAEWAEDFKRATAVVEEAESHARGEVWVQTLAHSPEFQRAGSEEARRRVACQLIPEMESLARSDSPWERRPIRKVVRSAWETFQSEILPGQEETIAAQARELQAVGLAKWEVAARLGMGTSKLNRILGQCPE